MVLETFYKGVSVYKGTQNNSNTLRPMKEISCYRIFAYLDCTKYNKINIHLFTCSKTYKQENKV